jgi:AraC family transcriptional activator of mtrCDE
MIRISAADLDVLMTRLDVNVIRLAPGGVAPGCRLIFMPADTTTMHYVRTGFGRIQIGAGELLEVRPHSLVVVPPRQPVWIECESSAEGASGERVEVPPLSDMKVAMQLFAGGAAAAGLSLICGSFRALYGSSIDLFAPLAIPIVEVFTARDLLDQKLEWALAEVASGQVGVAAMTATLIKQVLVTLLRRSLNSPNLWVERFSILSDPRIARVFAEMISRPGFPHSLQSLAQTAGLSRSVFMVRFTEVFGQSPMALLRELRMRHATVLLAANGMSIDQIAVGVGYSNRSSFLRAFRKSFGRGPLDYRAETRSILGV